jgi:hypothetical protein
MLKECELFVRGSEPHPNQSEGLVKTTNNHSREVDTLAQIRTRHLSLPAPIQL